MNVYRQPASGPRVKIWSKSGNQGNTWQISQVSLTSTTNFTIIFEGIIGSSYYSDMAIDDVSIKNGRCALPGAWTINDSIVVLQY